jgi:uncharacterized membrane protein YbaN (DUF454 family)
MVGCRRMKVQVDYSHEVEVHRSRVVRVLFGIAGTVALVLGIVGLFMPLLPTTPFILLAAACYARASVRFYNALLNNPTFGPLVGEWRRHRSIPYRTKMFAIVLMSVTLAASTILFVKNPYVQAALAVLGIALAVWLYRIPSRDDPRRRDGADAP